MIKKIDLPYTKGLFSIYFVYPKNQEQVIITGEDQEVNKYIIEHYPSSIFNKTCWKNKHCIHDLWMSNRSIYIRPTKSKNRKMWIVNIFEKDSSKELIFRNLPKKWIPEYDNATTKKI